MLLQAMDKYFPSPDHFECIGVDVSTGERFTAKYNDDVSLSARVFKTIVDPFIGKIFSDEDLYRYVKGRHNGI